MKRIFMLLMVVLSFTVFGEDDTDFLQFHGSVDIGMNFNETIEPYINQNFDISLVVAENVNITLSGEIIHDSTELQTMFNDIYPELGLSFNVSESINVGASYISESRMNRVYVKAVF